MKAPLSPSNSLPGWAYELGWNSEMPLSFLHSAGVRNPICDILHGGKVVVYRNRIVRQIRPNFLRD